MKNTCEIRDLKGEPLLFEELPSDVSAQCMRCGAKTRVLYTSGTIEGPLFCANCTFANVVEWL